MGGGGGGGGWGGGGGGSGAAGSAGLIWGGGGGWGREGGEVVGPVCELGVGGEGVGVKEEGGGRSRGWRVDPRSDLELSASEASGQGFFWVVLGVGRRRPAA